MEPFNPSIRSTSRCLLSLSHKQDRLYGSNHLDRYECRVGLLFRQNKAQSAPVASSFSSLFLGRRTLRKSTSRLLIFRKRRIRCMIVWTWLFSDHLLSSSGTSSVSWRNEKVPVMCHQTQNRQLLSFLECKKSCRQDGQAKAAESGSGGYLWFGFKGGDQNSWKERESPYSLLLR